MSKENSIHICCIQILTLFVTGHSVLVKEHAVFGRSLNSFCKRTPFLKAHALYRFLETDGTQYTTQDTGFKWVKSSDTPPPHSCEWVALWLEQILVQVSFEVNVGFHQGCTVLFSWTSM